VLLIRGILHKGQRKVMTLIPLKTRTGTAALTLAAVVAPFVLATRAKAIVTNVLGMETIMVNRYLLVVFAIGLISGLVLGYAVRAAISLRHRRAAMRRRYLL
jgi:hypothetical protein